MPAHENPKDHCDSCGEFDRIAFETDSGYTECPACFKQTLREYVEAHNAGCDDPADHLVRRGDLTSSETPNASRTPLAEASSEAEGPETLEADGGTRTPDPIITRDSGPTLGVPDGPSLQDGEDPEQPAQDGSGHGRRLQNASSEEALQ